MADLTRDEHKMAFDVATDIVTADCGRKGAFGEAIVAMARGYLEAWTVIGKARAYTESVKSTAYREEIEAAAKVADGFRCGSCGMDGKTAAAIRKLPTK